MISHKLHDLEPARNYSTVITLNTQIEVPGQTVDLDQTAPNYALSSHTTSMFMTQCLMEIHSFLSICKPKSTIHNSRSYFEILFFIFQRK